MAQLDFGCSISQGYNFQKDVQTMVGHLVKLKIGDTEITADTDLTDPADNTKSVTVVGPISYIQWQGGYADAVHVNANLTTTNQKTIALLTHTTLTNTLVEFQYDIYAFDQVAKVYYKAFHTDSSDIKGIILKQGGALALHIGTDPEMEVPSPLNYALSISIMPQEEAQAIQVAVSNTDKFSKAWGVKVA